MNAPSIEDSVDVWFGQDIDEMEGLPKMEIARKNTISSKELSINKNKFAHRISAQDFKALKVLGKGSYGNVNLVESVRNPG